MNPRYLAFLATTALAIVTGCSSTSTKVDSGAIQAKTFSFVVTDRPAPANTDRGAIINGMIQSAITRNLGAHGVSKVEGVGDVVVGYLIITGNNVSTMSVSDYFGEGRSVSELQEKATKAYSSSKNPNQFQAGTLVIDIIDAKTYKLLRRGHATRPVLKDITNEARAERIQGVVDEIFSDLRIAK